MKRTSITIVTLLLISNIGFSQNSFIELDIHGKKIAANMCIDVITRNILNK